MCAQTSVLQKLSGTGERPVLYPTVHCSWLVKLCSAGVFYSGMLHDSGSRPTVRFGSAVRNISYGRVCDINNSVSVRNRCVMQLYR